MINSEYGFGGMMTLDVGSLAKANALMELMQSHNWVFSEFRFHKTLFSALGLLQRKEITRQQDAMD
jgi:methionine-gamma-lyase